jgi:ABC-2 type transport system ATP-binding protein
MHWFHAAGASAAQPAPTVLMGPGWGQSGDTNTTSVGLFGSLGIGALQKAGYNVLT